MANIDATDLNDLQVTEARNDKRFQELGAVNIVKHAGRFANIIPEQDKRKLEEMSSDRSIQVPVIVDQTVVTTTEPSFNIPANLLESTTFTVTPINIFSGFAHHKAHYANNVLEAERAKMVKINNVLYAMGKDLEAQNIAVLEANKTQVLAHTTQISRGSNGQTYTFTGSDILEINEAAQQNVMFTSIDTVMAANDRGGRYSYLSSPAGFAVQKQEMATFGAGNTKNLQALGMADASLLHETNSISTSDNFDGFAVRDGVIEIITNHPYDYRNNTTVGSRSWSVSDGDVPFLEYPVNVMTNTEATDATALAASGTNSDLLLTSVETMSFWFRGYIVTEYNADLTTRSNAILKIQGKTT